MIRKKEAVAIESTKEWEAMKKDMSKKLYKAWKAKWDKEHPIQQTPETMPME